MTKDRRMGAEGSERRLRFVKAAEEILETEGYPKFSARRVAAKAGLTAQLLYYYFRTMDDVLVAVVRRVNERRAERFEEAVAAPDPLRALWELNFDPMNATLAAELTSIASHHEAVRSEIIKSAEQFRARQIEVVSRLLPLQNSDAEDVSAAGIIVIASAIARFLTTEKELGLTLGHAEVQQIVEQTLERLTRPSADRTPKEETA